MAEYTSGMLFSRGNNKFPSASQFAPSSLSQLYLPAELDIGPPLIQPKFKLNQNIGKDILLLAEFSEIEGPISLMTIPEQIPSNIDINEFVLQLMSTDYQNMGGDFYISKDTCLLQEDALAGHYVYVHYFTLYDVRARGFVRPMCLAYLSREAQKVKKYFKSIQKEFAQATEYMRVSNLENFVKDIRKRIEDLNFTKCRFIQTNNSSDSKDNSQNLFGREENLMDKNLFKMKESSNGSAFKIGSVNNEKEIEAKSSIPRPVLFSLTESFMKKPLVSSSPTLVSSSPNLSFITPKSRYEPLTFKGSPKETVLEASLSSDSSSSTIKSSSKDIHKDLPLIQISSLILDDSHDQKMTENEEASILQHTSLDTLSSQLRDCESILTAVQNYLKDTRTTREELKEYLEGIKRKPESLLYITLHDQGIINFNDTNTDGFPSTSPSVFVAALMRHNFKKMRKIKNICGVGYSAALVVLLRMYEKFSKSFLTLHFEELDQHIYQDPFCSLFIGSIPVINFGTCTSDRHTCNNDSDKRSSRYKDPYKRTSPIMEFEKSTGGQPGNHTSATSSIETKRISEEALIESKWNSEVARILFLDFPQVSTPDSEYADAVETLDFSEVTMADDCLEVFTNETEVKKSDSRTASIGDDSSDSENLPRVSSNPVKIKDLKLPPTPHRSTSSEGSWTSSSTRDFNVLDHIDRESDDDDDVVFDFEYDNTVRILNHNIIDRIEKSRAYRLSVIIQQFSGVAQCIIHSILSGKPMVVAGPEYLKPVVILYAKALSTILPCKTNQVQPVLKWHTGTITHHHIKLYKIIGICIPERLHVQDLMSISTLNQVTVLNIETGHISGVAYSGSLLYKPDQLSRKNFKSDASLQAALQYMLVSLGTKVFLLLHLLRTTSRSANDIMKGIGVPRGDWNMIHYLATMVNEQMEQNKH